MNDNFKITAEEQTKAKASAKKYIAAGMTAAVFALCMISGFAGMSEPETADLETDVIPTETTVAALESSDEESEPDGSDYDEENASEDTDEDKADEKGMVVNAAYGLAVAAGATSAFDDAFNDDGNDSTVASSVDEAEPVAAEEASETEATEANEEVVLNDNNSTDSDENADSDSDMEEIFDDEDSEVPTGSFVSDGTDAHVKSFSAKASSGTEVAEISAVTDAITLEADTTEAAEPEFADEIFMDEAENIDALSVSKFEAPDWLTLDENGVPTEYTEAIYGKSCAYTADSDALMSTGKEVFQGYVAVDPDVIPYGSELYIVADDGEVYGYAIAADTGYSVRQGHIVVDLFMDQYDDCIQWGAKNVTVYVLN